MAQLITRIAGRGDDEALTALYDRTNRQLYGLLLRLLGNAATAEEVLFDVYVQVWKQAARYDAARGTPLAWLITMTRSRALDRLRARKDETLSGEPLSEQNDLVPEAGPEDEAMHAEMRGLVQGALAALPPEQREVIEMAYYSGLSQSEIAVKLGQPLGTVKSRARRGMQRLKDLLNPVIEGIL
ncbi:MAG: sigma-70 family RNA polymerase sigma factor [Acidobacteriota bacterium]|nr:sigma-70 family RNA polymerase sigma factor [Acidobacteriota bacterium]